MINFTEMAVKDIRYWPRSSECNGLLHFDWRNNQYYSDFYGSNKFVQLVCGKLEFKKAGGII